ncbi:MAG: hypothetical protein ABWK05_06240 [Pyrobaculum sp.]
MSLAKIDVETLRCIVGESGWEFCRRLRALKKEAARLEAEVDKLLSAVV